MGRKAVFTQNLAWGLGSQNSRRGRGQGQGPGGLGGAGSSSPRQPSQGRADDVLLIRLPQIGSTFDGDVVLC